MDATRDDDVTPTLDELQRAVRRMIEEATEAAEHGDCDSGCRISGWPEELRAEIKRVDWLASHLPELIARKSPSGAICPTHGMAVLVTHVDDGEPCSDYLAAAHLSGERPR